ncbi:sulfite exporter TauE/SafE family protein [Proteiniclasticum sp. SCR006]|uniref:Probable membrane transporter protein n=1 Tax=Proteiniclasticum aestuarii TaxID=2817862 RepID=A0A939KJQ4_9CLOT|nr:sulfite exporter TauE/SafE family protein [Proteiniclasticum aestuarii]MBO1265408.1 sulfite exporter TauE/SafE family protein [Proteiniclasticum aestuarii]
MVIIALGAIVLMAHFLEGVTGFGCTVIALPFAIALIGVKTAVPVLTILSWILALYIVVTDRKAIVASEYFRILARVMLGLPVGVLLFASLPEEPLKVILGVFMIVIAAGGLYKAYSRRANSFDVDSKIGKRLMNTMLILGGVIHGAFSSGGPFIVVYATQKLTEKSAFRATLSAIWLTLNSIIIATNMLNRSYDAEAVQTLLFMIPFLLVGVLFGNIAHKKIKESAFSKLVYSVLLVSGVFMFA